MAVGFMAGSIISKMVMDTTKWKNSIKVVKKDADTLKGKAAMLAPKFKSIGRGMTIAGAAIAAGMAVGIKAFKRFDLAMTESLAIMGDVSDEMKTAMKEAALEMSGNSKFAASELAESYFFLASAGIDAAGAIKALPVVTQFAQAGAFGLARATDLLTDAQSALGLSSKDAIQNQEGMIRVSDVLVSANTLANASVSQFSEALTNRAGPSMRAYGVELESGVAVLAAFADQGVKGSEAGMQYAIVLRDLQKSAMENKGAFQAAGIAVFDANGNLNNMGNIIGQLETRLGGMSAEQKKAELTTLGFQERSQAALLTLVGTSDKIKEYEVNLRKAGGTTKEVSDKQLTSLSARMDMAKNSITNVGISLGEQLAPTLITVMNGIAKIGKAITKWASENKGLFKGLVIGVGVLGGLLAIFGPIVMMVPLVVAGFAAITASAAIMTAGIGFIVIALAALVIGITSVISANKKMEESTRNYAEVAENFEKKMRGITTAAGLTSEQFDTLRKKYKGNIQVMALAIKKGEEGIELQNAMNEVGEERVEQQEAEKKGNEALLPTIEDLIPPTIKLTTETKKYTDFLDTLGIKTLKEKGDRTKELRGFIDDLTAAYKRGEISLDDYRTALKSADDEMEELGTELIQTVIPATRKWGITLDDLPKGLKKMALHDYPGKMAIQAKKGARKVKTALGEISTAVTNMAQKWGDALVGMLGVAEWFYDEAVEFDNSLYKTKGENLDTWYEDQKKIIEDSLGNEEEFNDAMAKLLEDYYIKKGQLGADASEEALDALNDWYEGEKDIIEDRLGDEAVYLDAMEQLNKDYEGQKDILREDEEIARDQHREDELKKEKSFWNKSKEILGTAIEDMLKLWATKFLEKLVLDTAETVTDVVGSIGDMGKGALDLAKGFNPGGMIATAVGTAIGTFLGGLLGPKGPSANDTRLIKDNTWNTNQNVLNGVGNLDAMKWTLWGFVPVFDSMKLTLWDQTETLHRIEKVLGAGPSATAGGNGGGATSPIGTTVNINRIQNEVNINGIMITDRDYTRDRLIPEFLHALKQRSTKKRLQEILGIA